MLNNTRTLLLYFCLLLPCFSFAQTIIIPENDVWKFSDLESDPADQAALTWRDLNYDDSSWGSGPAELGYGDGDEATVIDDNVLTAYFRYEVDIPNLCEFEDFELDVLFDDGIVVWLNGVDVLRRNLPGGIPDYDVRATNTVTNNAVAGEVIPASLF